MTDVLGELRTALTRLASEGAHLDSVLRMLPGLAAALPG